MKNKILSAISIVAIIIAVSSCNIEKRYFMPGYSVEWNGSKNIAPTNIHAEKSFPKPSSIAENKKKSVSEPVFIASKEEVAPASANSEKLIYTEKNEPLQTAANSTNVSLPIPLFNPKEKALPNSCDIIVLNDGTQISAIVSEVKSKVIMYSLCDDATGKTLSIKKSKVATIKYYNGVTEVITPAVAKKAPIDPKLRKLDTLGIIAFFAGAFGVIISTWQVGPIAVILGIISLIRIIARKDKYKGLGWALLSILLGLICIGYITTAS